MVAMVAGLVVVSDPQTPYAQATGVAYLDLALPSGRPVATEHPEMIDVPMAPGSVAKIATLAAALEAETITDRTGILCTRDVVVAGHRLTCTHPDLHRPLEPAEALAYSCNVYFARVAARLPRPALDRALTSLGLPPSDPGVPLAAAALGLEGLRASPRRLLDMMLRVAAEPNVLPWRPETLAVVREGLHGAATFGTASSLHARGLDALAKTGTTLNNGRAQGLVVGVTPSRFPSHGFVLLASGAAGTDAAALAAHRLATAPVQAAAAVRVGTMQADGRYDVRTMALEDYVAGVVAGEAAPGSTPAALEALAITVRTFTLANRGRHASDDFDMCDLTHCQVLRRPSAETTRAAAATAGRILEFGGAPAGVYYTASCGGHSERPSAVWSGADDPPFLPSRPDEACDGEPAWRADLSVRDLTRALRTGGFRGDLLRDMRIVRRSSSGRAAWVRLEGFTPEEISGDDLRTLVGRTLGWQFIRSTAFEVQRTGAGFRFAGHGAGHGVGLCVIGAARRAAAGASAEAILAAYFPGLSIATLGSAIADPPRVRISLPASEQHKRLAVHDFAVHALSDLAEALGVNAPADIHITFYPTVESYQRATGQPWTTAAATEGHDIQVLPLSLLERRGTLESTIRHEFVHLLTMPALAGRPLWVAEGVASYFAGESGEARSISGTCPTDREMTRPTSADGLRSAYQRAAACVLREIDAGRSWREIR